MIAEKRKVSPLLSKHVMPAMLERGRLFMASTAYTHVTIFPQSFLPEGHCGA